MLIMEIIEFDNNSHTVYRVVLYCSPDITLESQSDSSRSFVVNMSPKVYSKVLLMCPLELSMTDLPFQIEICDK